MLATTSESSGRRRLAKAVDDVCASILALGLDPADALFDLAELVTLYGQPGAFSSIHRELVLERYGATDLPAVRHPELRREDVAAVAVRMGAIDTVASYSVEDAGKLLDIPSAEVRRRVEFRELWAFGHRDLRLPSWQFAFMVDDGPTRIISPYLPAIVEAIPTGAPPALVRGLMTLDDPTLSRHLGRLTSPRQWLIEGNAHMPVIALLLRNLEGKDDRVTELLWGKRTSAIDQNERRKT